MRKYFLLFFAFSISTVFSQNNLPPVFEITTDTALIDTLPHAYWQILEDKDGKLSFEQVNKSPVADKFHYGTAKTNKLNFSVEVYWSRYLLKNVMDHDAKVCFPTYGTQSDFYFITADGKITHKVNGFLTRWSKMNGLKLYNYIPVIIKPKEELLIYNRTSNKFSFSPPEAVSISSTEKIIQQNYIDNETHYFNAIHDSFIFGVLVFAALFVFFFFIIVRERLYLYFSLYLFFLGLGRFNSDFEFYHVFFREYPVFYLYFYFLLWGFSTFFLTYFIRHLLNTPRYLPWWNKFLFIFNLVYAFSYLLYFALHFYRLGWTKFGIISNDVITLLDTSLVMCMPVTFFLILLKGVKINQLLIVAVLPILSAWSVGLSLVQIYDVFGWKLLFPDFIVWLDHNWYLLETILLSLLVVFFSWILLHRFVDLRKEIVQKELEKEIERSQLIAQQKDTLEQKVTQRTAELKQSLEELKSTQAQLIQSEKMASLGELTAGIAHEIQNPLNFVNNFSEVSVELADELKEEINKMNVGEKEKENIENIITDLVQNQEKINQHGKRADAIVKSMLQHSRISTGQKESTDINALADEYLRLSYHGLRAKDKSFNATLQTDFDKTAEKINIIPQDIGRVLLNLFNNAFYSVMKKKAAGQQYDPTVSVCTKKVDGKIEIHVKDNGSGIPKKVLEKIFQPFFTTKAAGEGTGLGLSLSYDIIKAHCGDIKVKTEEGGGAEFVIQLPIN
jgi:two-component system NtrC family sensor kinase